MAEKRSKADVKREVLEYAIDRLENTDEHSGVGKLGKLGEIGGDKKIDDEKTLRVKKMLSQLTKKTMEL